MANQDKIDRIKKGKPFSPIDVVAIGLSLVICCVLVFYSCSQQKQGSRVMIKQSYESILTEYDINKDREIVIDCKSGTAIGLFVVVIQDGKVWVKESPCAGQDCVRMPPLRETGRKIVCTHCRISIWLEGGGDIVASV